MGLFERITADDDTKIGVHSLGAAMREVARGNATLSQLETVFSTDAQDDTDLSAIAAKYTATGGTLGKALFLMQIEDAMILAEEGIYNKTQVKDALGF